MKNQIFKSKEIHKYCKMHRKHRKELIKLVKETREWDFGWLHDMVIMQIRHMYEYYSAGNNVCQSEETLNRVLESLKHTLDLQDELDTLWDKERDDLTNYNDLIKRESELYAEIYAYIGQNIQWWWD